jgi:betaine-aldehyde dehydrogenase
VVLTHGLFIDGVEVAASDAATYDSINPADGSVWACFADASPIDVDRAVAAARKAHDAGVWRQKPVSERAQILRAAADLFSDHHSEIAAAEIADSGATMRKANGADIIGATMSFQEHANLIEAVAFEEAEDEYFPIEARSIIRREPVGVVGAIVPFNFPFAAASWKVAPALAAGCTVVLKPSPHTPATALIMARLCTEAGVPPGVINVVTGASPQLGAALVAHKDVDKVSFTGSTAVGKTVMKACADRISRCLLELGGKSANIILDDADLDIAVPTALFATFFHAGQVCESGTRILVADRIYDAFVERFAAEAEQIVVGDPMNPETTMGPLISAAQLARTEAYVASLKADGARLLFGGARPDHTDPDGFYYLPTCFCDATNAMRGAREEIFGPVVVIIRCRDDADSVAIANDSDYGLAGAVWSTDEARALAVARQLQTGTVWINDYHMISPKYPFGGYKQSGLGRELGRAGIEEYLELKTIHVGRTASRAEKHYLALTLKDG